MNKQEKAFEKLKKRFTEELVLAALDLDKKNEDGSRHIVLCNWRSTVNGRQRWDVEASSISLKIFKQDRKKLQDSR